jgi:hypothetical protein
MAACQYDLLWALHGGPGAPPLPDGRNTEMRRMNRGTQELVITDAHGHTPYFGVPAATPELRDSAAAP